RHLLYPSCEHAGLLTSGDIRLLRLKGALAAPVMHSPARSPMRGRAGFLLSRGAVTAATSAGGTRSARSPRRRPYAAALTAPPGGLLQDAGVRAEQLVAVDARRVVQDPAGEPCQVLHGQLGPGRVRRVAVHRVGEDQRPG